MMCFILSFYKWFVQESDVESLCLQCGLEISTSGTEKGLSFTKPSLTHKPARDFEKYYPMDSERIERYLQYELFREHHFSPNGGSVARF